MNWADNLNIAKKESAGYERILQQALFPDANKISEYFSESFIFHQPKSELSGDFFWFEKREDTVYIACADCTGHGVPGALLSFMAITMLNHLIMDDHITDTGEVLNRLNRILYNALNKKFGSKTVFDGLEIGIVSFNESNRSVQYVGAGCPLYQMNGDKLITHPGSRASIGHSIEQDAFVSEFIECDPGDSLYLFSDGFPDQFGGVQNSKFKYKNLRNLISTLSQYPMNIQEELLKDALRIWQGSEEQTDDITAVAVQLPF